MVASLSISMILHVLFGYGTSKSPFNAYTVDILIYSNTIATRIGCMIAINYTNLMILTSFERGKLYLLIRGIIVNFAAIDVYLQSNGKDIYCLLLMKRGDHYLILSYVGSVVTKKKETMERKTSREKKKENMKNVDCCCILCRLVCCFCFASFAQG